MVKILHLTLKRKYFDAIATGKKKTEYRECKPYWTKRFFDINRNELKIFDEVHFTNGYGKDRPFMRVEWKGLGIVKSGKTGKLNTYTIKLGDILEIKNWIRWE